MTTIAIVGATGYAGSHITSEALSRGHQVIAVSRSAPADDRAGVTVRKGTVTDTGLVSELAAAADAVVLAVPSLPDDGPELAQVLPGVLDALAPHGTRLAVVGGAGSLRVSPDGLKVYETPEFPAHVRPTSEAHERALAVLKDSAAATDWFVLSPAVMFGSFAPGEATGSYRVGDDVAVWDENGKSAISGSDYALALVDEIDQPKHHRARFTAAS